MDFFEIENLRSVLKAKWLRRPVRPPMLHGIAIDSREELSGKAFVAIKGDTHDGHAFLDAAVRSGAGLLIVEREDCGEAGRLGPEGVGVLQVDDSRRALARMAQAYRRTLRGTKVIAVTGSAGKTTTKRLIHAVLSTQMQGASSPKSFNNEIGLPLTILQAKLSDKFLVVEIGTNAPGEIAQLAAIAEPDLAVITMIGRAHLEGLGSVEAIAKEKASLLTHLQANGVAIMNADVPLLRAHLKLAKHRVLFGEADDAELRLTGRGECDAVDDRGVRLWWFEMNGRSRFEIALPGKHNALNAIAAIAVGRRMGLDDGSIAIGLRSIVPDAMRMTAQKIGDTIIYNDAYNANPDSMIAALETFAEMTGDAKRRVVILGDMLELGDAGPQLHRELGRQVVGISERRRIERAVFIGELSGFAAAEAARKWPGDRVIAHPGTSAECAERVAELIHPGDAVLVKASRGMQLERIIEALHARSRAASAASADEAAAGIRDRVRSPKAAILK